MRILVYGLSGSGKSTLADRLSDMLPKHAMINGDALRAQHNDWDFSKEGRLRQANRVKDMLVDEPNAIIDLVCPLQEMRDIIAPDMTILMDTIESCQYPDTNAMFERGTPDIIIPSFDYKLVDILRGVYG